MKAGGKMEILASKDFYEARGKTETWAVGLNSLMPGGTKKVTYT